MLITGFFRSIPIYFLWNWLAPSILGLSPITFSQSIGISFLSAFLFTPYTGNLEEIIKESLNKIPNKTS